MDRGRPTTTCDSSRRRERRRAGPNRTQDRRRALDRQREPLPTRVDVTPPLPAAYHRALEAGLQEIGVELSSAQRSAIDGHVRLLLAWNRSINLTAIRDPEAAATRARHRQPHRAPRDARARAPALRRPGQRWRVPGAPRCGGAPGRAGAARRLHREEGPLPRCRRGGGRDGGDHHDLHRSGGAARAATPSTAGAGRRSWRVPSPPCPSSSSSRSRCWPRAACSSPGSGADVSAEADRRDACHGRAGRRHAADHRRVGHRARRASAGDHHQDGPTPDRFPRDPAVRRRTPVVSGTAATLRPDADRCPFGHPQQSRRP